MEQTTTEKEQAEARVQALDKELEQVKTELETTNANYEDQCQDLVDTEIEKQSAKARVTELETQSGELRQQLQTAETTVKELTAKVTELEIESSTWENDYYGALNERDAVVDRVAQLKGQPVSFGYDDEGNYTEVVKQQLEQGNEQDEESTDVPIVTATEVSETHDEPITSQNNVDAVQTPLKKVVLQPGQREENNGDWQSEAPTESSEEDTDVVIARSRANMREFQQVINTVFGGEKKQG